MDRLLKFRAQIIIIKNTVADFSLAKMIIIVPSGVGRKFSTASPKDLIETAWERLHSVCTKHSKGKIPVLPSPGKFTSTFLQVMMKALKHYNYVTDFFVGMDLYGKVMAFKR